MNSLAAEYRALYAARLIDEATAQRTIALDRGSIFPLAAELRFCFYAAVAAMTSGIGILLKNNLDRVGPLTLIIALALISAGCYAISIRTLLRQKARSTGGDYILLLGALLVSADLGYAESQFHWFGLQWSRHLLLLAVIHSGSAYALRSRLLLSLGLTSLAAWFGIEARVNQFFSGESELARAAPQALICAAVLFAWREIHRRLKVIPEFLEVFEHFAVNIGFWGALALCCVTDTRLGGLAVLLLLAALVIRRGVANHQEILVVYGISYAALGLCVLEAELIQSTLAAAVCGLATVVVAVLLLWRLRSRMRVPA